MAEITVTATITYTYDPDDGIVTNAEQAEDDVRDLLDSGDVPSGAFTFTTKEH